MRDPRAPGIASTSNKSCTKAFAGPALNLESLAAYEPLKINRELFGSVVTAFLGLLADEEVARLDQSAQHAHFRTGKFRLALSPLAIHPVVPR